MARLKYYQLENERYRELRDSRITEDEATKALAKLCRHFGLDNIPIDFVNGMHRSAHYSVARRRICLVRNWMNWKTLAHEFAHYWDDMKRKQEIAAHNRAFAETSDVSEQLWHRERINKIKNANWHGKRHAKLIDRAIRYIQKKGWNTGLLKPQVAVPMIQLPPAPKPVPVISADLRASVFAALPEQLQCPKCNSTKHKSEFGVRVMAKDAAGNPIKVIRQSYCKPCRLQRAS